MKKLTIIITLIILIISILLPINAAHIYNILPSDFKFDKKIEVLSDDLLRVIEHFDPELLENNGPGPGYYDTSEYMIGSVAIGVIFLESNGAIDPSTENWITSEETNVQNELLQSMNWWASQYYPAGISFTFDVQLSIPVSYEPIIHPCAMSNPYYEKLWISEAMGYLGYTSGDWLERTRDYVNAIRSTYNTDWAYTVFIVDSSADVDGCFSDGFFAYAYLGGPYCVMTYDNNGWGISAMDQVFAHETGHIFWATDEYDGYTEYSGYLNAADVENSGCLMDTNALSLSSGTILQIGWLDTDADNIPDIIDTNPDTILPPYSPNPTSNPILTYTGNAVEVAYPNNNPQQHNPGNDVSINHIAMVFYRINGGYYYQANPVDGIFDEPEEDYLFTTPPLPIGIPHTIEAISVNRVSNPDLTPATDTVIIDNPPDNPTINGPTEGSFGEEYNYSFYTNDVDGDLVYFWIDWGDSSNSGWLGPFLPGSPNIETHMWSSQGDYTVKIKAKDTFNMESDWTTLQISMPLNEIHKSNSFLKRKIEYFSNIYPLYRYLLKI